MSSDYSPLECSGQHPPPDQAYETAVSDANIRNFAPVARIMKTALPENAKIAKEAKECMQECVSEFISFITSEGGSEPNSVDGDLSSLADAVISIGEVPAGEEKNRQWRRHSLCHDFIRLRELCRSAQSLSDQVSRGKVPFDTPFLSFLSRLSSLLFSPTINTELN